MYASPKDVRFLFAVAVTISAMGCAKSADKAIVIPVTTQVPQPIAPVRPVTDSYHGTEVVDPYRYMENVKDLEVVDWMKGQADYTRAVLDQLSGREVLRKRVEELWNSSPAFATNLRIIRGHYYTLSVPAGAKQPKLYVRDNVNAINTLLIDPEKLPGGESGRLAIQWYSPSPDNRYIAYSLAAGGSEAGTTHILDVTTGKDLTETSDRIQYVDWHPDGNSFFYNLRQRLTPGMPATAKYENQSVLLHTLGKSFESDLVILGQGVNQQLVPLEKAEFPIVSTTPNSRFALATVSAGTDPRSRIYTASLDDLKTEHPAWREIASTYDDNIIDVGLRGDSIYLLSLKGTPNGSILSLDLSKPDSKPRVIVSEGKQPISSIAVNGDALYWRLNDAGINSAYRLRLGVAPTPEIISTPYPADVSGITTDAGSDNVVLSVSSWIHSPAYLSLDGRSTQATTTSLQPSGPLDKAVDLTVEEVRVKSWDGTMVPLSIVSPTGLARDGRHAAYLSGYGAYGISSSPDFLPPLLALSENGAVQATCHVRGGGEFGEEWHKAGFQETKPNTWKDFIACAEYLIKNGYTSSTRLVGSGGSAGGIMIGRAIEERPELFAAAIAIVPASDLLRSETTANGPPNIPEFGSTRTEAGFRSLLAMSPLANVRDNTRYPAVLITTGINDPRVDAWGPAKLAARLQAATSSKKPVLLRVDYNSGHGGNSIDLVLDQIADMLAFTFWQTGHPDFQPKK